MYLKRLEIQGFKSFANKTVLEFVPPQDGRFSITAIVGPNGSGKSNITDAIRWVMGEQAMKHVRAKKSEDVIFSGSENKGALSAAEVTMVLDNSAADVAVDFPEISITRRLYRTGESEYIVNNNPARLLDIHLLLAQAQFAEHAYSIVSQGMIDRLLTVTPSERKDFFDEASGIKEHQIKQHQASLKLARTEENIHQADTLLAEVEPRLKMLAKQVKKLEKRQEVETELFATSEQYYLSLYRKNQTEIDAFKNERANADEKYRAAFAELEQIQNELAALARGASRQAVFTELQARHQTAVRAKNDLERQLAIVEGQLHTEYSQAGAHNVGWLETKAAELKDVVAAKESEAKEAEHALVAALRALEDGRSAVDKLVSEEANLKLKIARLQNELYKDQSEQQYRHMSGLTAVKAVLEAGKQLGKVYGLVAELGEVPESYALALEVAAGAHLSSVVVEDEEVARRAIEYLRTHRYGVATFLPLSKIQARSGYAATAELLGERGVIGKALDLITYSPRFANIFSMIFGDTIVIENLEVAKRLGVGRARMVTLDGDLVEFKGIMRGGFRSRQGLTFSAKLSLTNDDHLAEVQAAMTLENNNLADRVEQLKKAQQKLMELEITSRSASERVKIFEESLAKSRAELSGVEQELKFATASPESWNDQLKKLQATKTETTGAVAVREQEIAAIAAQIEEFNTAEETKKQRVFTLQEEMQSRQLEVNGIVASRSDINVQLAKVETKQEDLAHEVYGEMKTTLAALVERAGNMEVTASTDQLLETIQKLKYQLSLIGGIDEEVVGEYATTKERYDFLTTQLDDLKSATDDLNKMIAELDELMKKKRAAAFKKIRKDFDRYFQILFGGGHADLQEIYGEVVTEEAALVDENGAPAAPTEEAVEVTPQKPREKVLTGIDVIANPPGKKVKYLNMLSGGERTLTSIALICAILYHNPSPFVVLDEVEAALDEANTLRFAKIMAELSTHSQFIIVTHNRVTMHAANALYGVVMGADGVSKLLSVKMEEAPNYAEPTAVDKKA